MDSRAFMIAANEMTGFSSHGGQAYPPVFPWYVLGTPQGATTTTDLVVKHAPLDANFISECHKLGIKCLCYITFSVGPPAVSITSQDPSLIPSLESDTYMGVEFSSVWWEKALGGSVTTQAIKVVGVGIGLGTGGLTGVPVPCCNTRSYVDAMLAWIDVIMGLGADGVFVDVVQLRHSCYGDLESAGNSTPHAHLYTHRSRIPELNPSDPADPFANWIAEAVASGSQTLAEAQEDAGRQGAQNWAYTQLLREIRARIRRHKPDGAVVGNVGFPNYPGQWMQWFQPYFDAVMIENFITFVEGPGVDREQEFGGLVTGFYNEISPGRLAAWQPPGTPATVLEIPWPTMVTGNLRPWVDSGHRLITLSWISNITTTPANKTPSSSYDVPAREDAFFTYGAAQLAGGSWWGGPVYFSSPDNPDTDFGDLHQIVLGRPVGGFVEFDSSGQVQAGETTPPVVTVGVLERGVVALNWTNEPSPIVPGASQGNPNLAGQARVYLYEQQPAFGSQSIQKPGLQPWPAPSNATSFGPGAPPLPGGSFLYTWVSDDVFGTRFLTGPGGTEPYPWSG